MALFSLCYRLANEYYVLSHVFLVDFFINELAYSSWGLASSIPTGR